MDKQSIYNEKHPRRCRIHRLIIPLAFFLLALSGGCGLVSDDESDCPVIETGDADKVTLQFNMESGAILTETRADDYHTETDSEWPAFENQINVRDLGLFVFYGNGDDAPLIAKNTNIINSSNSTEMITGMNGIYTITMSVERDEIEDRLSEDDTNLTLRILVLANCYSGGANGGGNFSKLTANLKDNNNAASTFSEIIKQAEEWGFDISEIYSPNEGDSFANGLWKGYIPMFGTNTFNISRETLLRSTMGEMIYLGEVNMLRALAKVRVEDNIANKVNGLPRISEVQFRSLTDMAYSLPNNATQYVDGQQVHQNYHIHAKSESQYDWYAYKLGKLSVDNDTRIGYVPEQSIADALPAFYIKVLTKEATSSSEGEYMEFVVPMSGYGDQDFKFDELTNGNKFPYILRNHIYTLSVEDVETGGPATIRLTVDDWVPTPVYELDYMNIPVVQTPISWEEGTYYNNDEANGELAILPFSEGNAVAAVCHFNISRPLNGTWTAHLLTTSGTEGAFALETENASGGYTAVQSVSGTIDGNDISLRIIGTNPSPAEQNVAILQITVLLADGTLMEADICDKDYSNYKIIQNTH